MDYKADEHLNISWEHLHTVSRAVAVIDQS